MKIYYEPQESIVENDDFLEKSVADLDKITNEEAKAVLKIVMNQYRAAYYKYRVQKNELEVAKAHWKLRSLEKEIDGEGGAITLLPDVDRFKIIGFTDDLTERIFELLTKG